MNLHNIAILLFSPFILIACSNSSSQASSDYKNGSMPSTQRELQSYLEEAVYMGSLEIPKMKQAIIESSKKHPLETYPVVPLDLKITEDGYGLLFINKLITDGLSKLQTKALVEILKYQEDQGDLYSIDKFCNPNTMYMMQDLGYYIVEEIYLDSDLIIKNIYNFELCDSYFIRKQIN